MSAIRRKMSASSPMQTFKSPPYGLHGLYNIAKLIKGLGQRQTRNTSTRFSLAITFALIEEIETSSFPVILRFRDRSAGSATLTLRWLDRAPLWRTACSQSRFEHTHADLSVEGLATELHRIDFPSLSQNAQAKSQNRRLYVDKMPLFTYMYILPHIG